jgi:hypothetical protein
MTHITYVAYVKITCFDFFIVTVCRTFCMDNCHVPMHRDRSCYGCGLALGIVETAILLHYKSRKIDHKYLHAIFRAYHCLAIVDNDRLFITGGLTLSSVTSATE